MGSSINNVCNFSRFLTPPLTHIGSFLVHIILRQFGPIFNPSQLLTSFMDGPYHYSGIADCENFFFEGALIVLNSGLDYQCAEGCH